MSPESLESALTLASAIGEAFVLVFIIYRRIWRIVPMFSTFMVWTILSDLTGIYVQRYMPGSYLVFYVREMTADSILQFAVLVELAWSVLRPVRASLPKQSIFVLVALIAIAGAVIWPIAGMSMPEGLTQQSRTIFHLVATFAILRIVCFLVMAGFSQLLSIGWRDRELQIATGFGVYSIVFLLVTLMHSQHTIFTVGGSKLDDAVSLSYLGTLSYWVLSFSAKEQERKDFTPQMRDFLLQVSGGGRKS